MGQLFGLNEMRALLVLFWAFLVAKAQEVRSSIDEELLIPNETESAGSADETCIAEDSSFGLDSGNSTSNDKEDPVEEELLNEALQKPVFFEKQDAIKYPFAEQLTLKPLPRNYMVASFQFQMASNNLSVGQSETDFDAYRHYTVFPKAISPILEYTNTRQLHLRFTHGLWDSESWGQLPHKGSKSGGNGVELWAVIEAGSKEIAFRHWVSLANSLSGLFCSSINFIDSERTTYPVSSFQPQGDGGLPVFNATNGLFLIRAALANEPICTENLTPFLKLLPTRGKSGISSLLDGHKVFDSNWHSMSLDVETTCDGNGCKYHMEELIEMVFNVPNTLARAEKPIPKPVKESDLKCDESKPHDNFECFPLPQSKEIKFRLSELFGKQIVGSSLISESPSQICADVSDNWKAYIDVDNMLFATDNNCFSVKENKLHDLYLESDDTTQVTPPESVPLYVSRSLTGYGQDSGGLRTVFKNPGNESVNAIYFEALPWYMRIYLSSLKIESADGLEIEDVVRGTYYLPAIDRERPTHLEYNLTIPANTTIALSYQFDKGLLKYAEYPPDANHGFEIESAVVTVLEPVRYEMRTATLLLSLSTPDFSMPYNVIILTSTVMGLAFGTLFNLMVKRLVPLEEADRQASLRPGLKGKVARMLKAFSLKRKKVDEVKKRQ